jgi:hypothetical protein
MSEEEFDTEPEPTVEEKPSLTQTILSAISEEDKAAEVETPTSPATPDFSEITKTSRGPPGGGRLIREGAPERPASGPPTRGPPGVEVEPPVEETEDIPTLTPILRPVLQPSTRKVLTPVKTDISKESEKDEVTVLKPINRAVLKPITESTSEEEE